MKFFSAFLLILTSNIMFSQNLKEFRTLLQSGESSEKSAKDLIQKSEEAFLKSKEPIFASFLAVGHFFMAKHVFSPFKKMSHFNEGKKIMDNAVLKDPKNVEIRLMRLSTQENAPKILGYTKNIEEDKKVIISEYQNIKDEDLKIYVKKILKL